MNFLYNYLTDQLTKIQDAISEVMPDRIPAGNPTKKKCLNTAEFSEGIHIFEGISEWIPERC